MTIATITDAEEILSLQRLAFITEARIYNDYNILPLVQTLEELISDFNDQVFFKELLNGQIVGSVRAFEKNNTCLIGRLIVHPSYQNQGIGKKLMNEVEAMFGKKCNRYEIFTGYRSEKNICFYKKLGYKIFDCKYVTGELSLVYLEKNIT